MKPLTLTLLVVLLTGCATTETAYQCDVSLQSPLRSAMNVVEDKLDHGCGLYYEDYVNQLISIASENPGPDNKKAFSDFLVRLSDQGVISKRQASDLYNRYFNVKFVSLTGDYNTCSQVCPVQGRVMLDMQQELLDKETGLLTISDDQTGYYRADLLLKEAEIVLQATCQACSSGLQ